MREPIDALRSLKKYVAMALADDDDWEVRLAYEEGTFERPFCRVETSGDAAESGSRHAGELVMPVQVLAHPREKLTADEAILEAERVRSILRRAFRIGAGAIPPPPAVELFPTAGVLPAGTYTYRVTARTRFGESAASAAAEATLAAPGGVLVEWPEVPGARAYRVYRGVAAGPELVIAEVLVGTTSPPEFLDTGARRSGAAVYLPGRGTLGQPMSVPLWDWDDVPFEATTAKRLEPDFMRVRGLTTNRVGDNADPVRQSAVVTMRLAWRAGAARIADRSALDGGVVMRPFEGSPDASFDVITGD